MAEQTVAHLIPEVSQLISEINQILHQRSEERSIIYKEQSDLGTAKRQYLKDALKDELNSYGGTPEQTVALLVTWGAPKRLELELLAHQRNNNDDYYPALHREVEKYTDNLDWAMRRRDEYDNTHVRARVLQECTSKIARLYEKAGMLMPELTVENYVPRKRMAAFLSSNYRKVADLLDGFPGGASNYFKSLDEVDQVAAMRQSLAVLVDNQRKLQSAAQENVRAALSIKRRTMTDAEFVKEMVSTAARDFSERKTLPVAVAKIMQKHAARALAYAQVDAKSKLLQEHLDACEPLDSQCRHVYQQLSMLHSKLNRVKKKHATNIALDLSGVRSGLRTLSSTAKSVNGHRETMSSYEFTQPILHRSILSQDMYTTAYWMLLLSEDTRISSQAIDVPSFAGAGGTFDGAGASGDWSNTTADTPLDTDTRNNLFGLAGLSAALSSITAETESIAASIADASSTLSGSVFGDDSYRSSGSSNNSYGSNSDTGSSDSGYSGSSTSSESNTQSYSAPDTSSPSSE